MYAHDVIQCTCMQHRAKPYMYVHSVLTESIVPLFDMYTKLAKPNNDFIPPPSPLPPPPSPLPPPPSPLPLPLPLTHRAQYEQSVLQGPDLALLPLVVCKLLTHGEQLLCRPCMDTHSPVYNTCHIQSYSYAVVHNNDT